MTDQPGRPPPGHPTSQKGGFPEHSRATASSQHGGHTSSAGGSTHTGLRSDGSARRSARSRKAHNSKYKVRKHGASTLATGGGAYDGAEEESHAPPESATEEEGTRRHGRRRDRPHHRSSNAESTAPPGRKHASKTIIGKLGMTAGTQAAAARTHTLLQCGDSLRG